MKLQEKMRQDWDRRASVDPYYWVAATQEADLQSYQESADKDTHAFLQGLIDFDEHIKSDTSYKDIANQSYETLKWKGRILDLGCGIGRMSTLLAKHFDEVIGVDVSVEMIRKAESLHSDIEGVKFLSNSGSDLSMLDDESFRFACSYSVLSHLPTDVVAAYLIEVSRVLEPQGIFRYQFWIGEPHHPESQNTISIHVYANDHLAQMHQRAGLTEVKREEIDYYDPILKLKPVWVTVRKTAKPQVISPIDRDVSSELSPEELEVEYGLMLHLSIQHQERGERMEAEAILQQAIQIAPYQADAYLEWATSRIEQDDLKGALLLLEELTRNIPELPQGWLFRAQAALGEEEYASVLELLKPIAQMKLDSDSDEWHMYLALKREAESILIAKHKSAKQQTQKNKQQSQKKSKKKRKKS